MGVPVAVTAFIVLLVLKLADAVLLSWWWVTAPLWLPVLFFMVVVWLGKFGEEWAQQWGALCMNLEEEARRRQQAALDREKEEEADEVRRRQYEAWRREKEEEARRIQQEAWDREEAELKVLRAMAEEDARAGAQELQARKARIQQWCARRLRWVK